MRLTVVISNFCQGTEVPRDPLICMDLEVADVCAADVCVCARIFPITPPCNQLSSGTWEKRKQRKCTRCICMCPHSWFALAYIHCGLVFVSGKAASFFLGLTQFPLHIMFPLFWHFLWCTVLKKKLTANVVYTCYSFGLYASKAKYH